MPESDKQLSLITKAEESLLEIKAQEIELLDLREVCDFCDFAFLASANNTPHLKAISRELERMLAENKFKPYRKAGNATSGWMIIDCGDLMIHLFRAEKREYYDLENLWKDADFRQIGNG